MGTTAVFVFDEFPDGEVTVRLSPVSMRDYFDFLERWNADSTIGGFRAEIAHFAEIAQPTWTFPAASFEDLDYALVKAIVNAWVKRVPEVPVPLPLASSGTERSREPSTETPAAEASPRRSSRARSGSTPS